MRTFPGVYLAAARHPGTGPAMAGLAFGQPLQVAHANENCGVMFPRGPGRPPTGRWDVRPGCNAPHAGMGDYPAWTGAQNVNGDAANRMMIQCATSGVAGTRCRFPRRFGMPGTDTRMSQMDTPAAGVYEYLASMNGAPIIINRPGNGGSYVPPQASPARPITPGASGKSAAVIPTSGAQPLAGAPGASGVNVTSPPVGSDVGTINAIAPAQPVPTYVPDPNTVDEAGGFRIAEPPNTGPPLSTQPSSRGKIGAALVALFGLYLLTAKK